MKKNQLKNYLKIGILLFGVPLLILNCQKDDNLNAFEQSNKERQINFLSEKELPNNILKFLENKANRFSKSYASRTEDNGTTIDVDNIMQVIDTIGNINYTFRINVDDNDETTFFNLVVNENTESENNISYILKYQIEQSHLQNWIDNNYDFTSFTGKVYRYNISDFFNAYSYASKTSFANKVSGVDDCPCNIEPIDDGTSGNPSGGGSGSGTGGDSGGGLTPVIQCYTTYTTYDNPCDGNGNPDDVWYHAHDPVGGCSGTTGPITIATTECHTYYTSSKMTNGKANKIEDDCLNPCDDDPNDGEIGILLPPPPSPCNKMKELANDDTFKGYLSAMKTFATSTDPNANREIAYTRTNDGNYSDVFVGELGADRIDVAVPNPINIHIHTHQPQSLDPDSLPVYSASDLYNIYWLLDNDKITDFKDFALTLVTQTTTYAIRIKSKTAFLAAFQNFFNIPGDTDADLGIKFLEDMMKKQYEIDPAKSDTHNETQFVKMLESINKSNGGTGLQLFKANTDYSQWSPLAINKFGQVSPLDCE